MRIPSALAFSLAIACGPKGGDSCDEPGACETDSAADTDTDSPPDTDSDTDTDADTDADTDTDTEACGFEDLRWTAQTRHADGTVDTVFNVDETITGVGIVANPCTTDVDFLTPHTCLVREIYVFAPDPKAPVAEYFFRGSCAVAETLHHVPAGSTIEESLPMAVDYVTYWSVSVSFEFPKGAGTIFTTVD